MTDQIFTDTEHQMFQALASKARVAMHAVPVLSISGMIQILLLIGIVAVDYVMFHEIFSYLSAGESWWNPSVMACTAMVMLTGFHLLARRYSHNRLLKTMSYLAALTIAAFACGGGLYLAVIIYQDGLGDAVGSMQITLGGVTDTDIQSGLIDWTFEHINGPAATIILSLGIGGLTVVSLFAAHHLVEAFWSNSREITMRRNHWCAVAEQLRTINQCEEQNAALSHQLEELAGQDKTYWLEVIAAETADAIDDALTPHEQLLQLQSFGAADIRWETDSTMPTARVETTIQKIRAITLDDLRRAINPSPQH